jgi:hypothetical protein
LGKFFSVANDLKLGITQNIAAIVFEQIGHAVYSFRCLELQRMNAH